MATAPIEIKAHLKRGQALRLSLLRHFQRPTFYLNALMFAGFTAFAFLRGPLILMLVGWLPLTVYIIVGIVNAVQSSSGKDQPHLLPTRYEFDSAGVHISNPQGKSTLGWEQFSRWDKLLDCYVLALYSGSIIAIPEKDVSRLQAEALERILNSYLR